MSIFDKVINDHHRVEAIFTKFKQGISYEEAKSLYTQLYEELNAHSIAEEGVLYPALARFPELSDFVREAYKEQAKVKALFGEMAVLEITSEKWNDKMATLIADVKAHAKEEEEGLFPKVRGVISQQQAEILGQQFDQAKKQAMPLIQSSLPLQEMQMTNP
jgi:hemerythrin superfamily protein